jgi:AraC family transcriptional regulator, arabinose operon regulatory protein
MAVLGAKPLDGEIPIWDNRKSNRANTEVFMPKKASGIVTAADRLQAAGLDFQRVEDVPAERVRAVNRFGFQDMRSIVLSPQVIRGSLNQPLLCDLLVTRIGYATRLCGHYIPRPEGSLDHILLLCPHGSGWLKLMGRDWKVGPATLCCLPAKVPHWYGADDRDPWSIYWIHLTGRQAGDYFRFLDVAPDRPLLQLSGFGDLIALFEAAWSAMKLVHVWDNLVRASIQLVRFFGLLRELQQRPDQRSRDRAAAVAKSIHFMNEHLSAAVSLAELANLAEMSVTRYAVEFRHHSGCSPMEYLNRVRVQRACELLRNTNESIREIGAKAGFPDPYYFSRAFKKIAGCSPSAFRKGQGSGLR